MKSILYADSTRIKLKTGTIFDKENLFPTNGSKIPIEKKDNRIGKFSFRKMFFTQ